MNIKAHATRPGRDDQYERRRRQYAALDAFLVDVDETVDIEQTLDKLRRIRAEVAARRRATASAACVATVNGMNVEEKMRHALRIAQESLEDLDYSYVYEDEQLEGADEDDWRDIHTLIQRALEVQPRMPCHGQPPNA